MTDLEYVLSRKTYSNSLRLPFVEDGVVGGDNVLNEVLQVIDRILVTGSCVWVDDGDPDAITSQIDPESDNFAWIFVQGAATGLKEWALFPQYSIVLWDPARDCWVPMKPKNGTILLVFTVLPVSISWSVPYLIFYNDGEWFRLAWKKGTNHVPYTDTLNQQVTLTQFNLIRDGLERLADDTSGGGGPWDNA